MPVDTEGKEAVMMVGIVNVVQVCIVDILHWK